MICGRRTKTDCGSTSAHFYQWVSVHTRKRSMGHTRKRRMGHGRRTGGQTCVSTSVPVSYLLAPEVHALLRWSGPPSSLTSVTPSQAAASLCKHHTHICGLITAQSFKIRHYFATRRVATSWVHALQHLDCEIWWLPAVVAQGTENWLVQGLISSDYQFSLLSTRHKNTLRLS